MAAAVAVSERADAKRNRARLVASAGQLFAAEGVDVSAREIARRAGVGVATLYRHFPTREDLVDAVLDRAFEELVELAERGLVDDDPWRGFTGFVERAVALHARNRALKDVVEIQTRGSERADAMRRRIRPLIRRLVARAQEAGALRADFAPQDVALLFWAGDRAIELAGAIAPELWRRQLGFLFDGLRAEAATPLAHGPLSDAQLRRVGAERRRPG